MRTNINGARRRNIWLSGAATGVTDEYNFGIIPRNKDNRRGSTDSFVFRGKLLWEASPDLTFKIAGDYRPVRRRRRNDHRSW